MTTEKVNVGAEGREKVTKGNAIRPLVVRVPAALPSAVTMRRDGELIKFDIDWPEPHVQAPLDKSFAETLLNEFGEPYQKVDPRLIVDYVRSFEAAVDERRPTSLLPDAALHEFGELKPDLKTEPWQFIARYGLFRNSSIITTSGPHKNIWHCEISKTQFDADRMALRDLLSLWGFLKQGRLQEAKSLATEKGLDFADNPGHALSFGIAQHLGGLALELPGGERQPRASFAGPITKLSLEPGPPPQAVIKCEDVLTGLYALLFKAVVFREPWMQCRCGTLFQVTGKRKYCGAPCQKSAKTQRWRRKQVGKQLLAEQKKTATHQRKTPAVSKNRKRAAR